MMRVLFSKSIYQIYLVNFAMFRGVDRFSDLVDFVRWNNKVIYVPVLLVYELIATVPSNQYIHVLMSSPYIDSIASLDLPINVYCYMRLNILCNICGV